MAAGSEPNWKALVGYQTFAQLLSGFESGLTAAGARLNNWNPGSRTRVRYELIAAAIERVMSGAAAIIRNGFYLYASGAWLEEHAKHHGLTREQPRQAQGNLIVTCSGPTTVRPDHTFATAPNSLGRVVRFHARSEVACVAGANVVPVEAVLAGLDGNVAPGAITVRENVPAGVTAVTNAADWLTLEGLDLETEDRLRTRISAVWSAGGGETLEQYAAWALAADPAVVQARALQVRGEGSVDVLITGTEGAPSVGLTGVVTAYITAQKQLCRDVLVRGPSQHTTAVVATIWLRPDAPDALDEVQLRAVERVAALFNPDPDVPVAPLGIGASVRRTGRLADALKSAASTTEVVDRVDITTPASDIVVPGDGIAVLSGAPTITVRRYTVAADGAWVE